MSMDTLYSGSVIIKRPIMEVFDYAADIKNIPDWYPLYARVESVQPPTPGTIKSFKAFLTPFSWPYIRIDMINRVPGRRLVYRSWDVGLVCNVEFEALSGGTQLKAAISLWAWPSVVVGLFVQPLRLIGNDNIALFLLNLKARVEALDSETRPRIFFCYRRDKSRYVGGRIYDALRQQFGEGYVFRDLESIKGGTHWQEGIERALDDCQVFVVHINDEWEVDLKRKDDFVRNELDIAIKQKIKIIPVYTSREDVTLATRQLALEAKLSDDPIWKELKGRQGLVIRSDPDFTHDLEELLLAVWLSLRRNEAQEADR